jgi:hypothetical protein
MNAQRRQILLLFLIVFSLDVGYWLLVTAKDVLSWKDVSLLVKIIALICNSIIDALNLALFNPVGIAFILGMVIWFFKSKTKKPT